MKLRLPLLLKINVIFLSVLIFNNAVGSKSFNVYFPDVNVAIHAGVAPTFWNERGDFTAVACPFSEASPYVPLFKMPKFSKLFRVPWYIGLQIGYPLCNEQEIYFELNYRQAKGRTFTINPLMIASADIATFSMTPCVYRVVDSYIGFRAYKKTACCDGIGLFIGGKVGLAHHAKTNFTFTTASLIVPPITPFVSASLPLFFSNTVPAIGANFGLTYEIGCNTTLMVMAELVANCGPKANPNISFSSSQGAAINPVLEPNSFMIGIIGTQIIIPITIGFKYNF